MIARVWTAEARGNGESYARFFRGFVRGMQRLDGFEGAQLLRRQAAGTAHIKVISYWKSMKAIERFAGRAVERAHVEPEARLLLSRVGRTVRHFEVEAFAGAAKPQSAASRRR